MKFSSFSHRTILAILLVTLLSFNCNKQFDRPPDYLDPGITPNTTIAALKLKHTLGNIEFISEDVILSGIVIADDKSGNFYKSVVVQDETGGISVKIDDYNLFTSYPIGRKVYIKAKGLYLGDYNGMIEIGGAVDNSGSRPVVSGIAAKLAEQYVIKGSLNNEIIAKKVSVAELNEALQNTLVVLENYEFRSSDTSKTFADTTLTLSAVNYTINNCAGEKIILRNSSYSKFAGYRLPAGNGNITAVYTVFGNTKQLYIRDTGDIKFTNSRCTAEPGTGEIISIDALKRLHTGSDIFLDNYKTTGIVISNAIEKNISSGSIILQNGESGILLNFGSNTDVTRFMEGDSLVVDVSGGILMNDQGSMKIQLTAAALPVAASAINKKIEPMPMSVAELTARLPSVEYCLIRITGATVSGNTTYGGNNLLSDATGNIILFTRPGCSFYNEPLPQNSADFIGFGNVYNGTAEFQIRSLNDVIYLENPPSPKESDLLISEYVEGSSYNKYLEIYNEAEGEADLSQYTLSLYKNGSAVVSNTVRLDELTGQAKLYAKEFIVIAHPRATLSLPPQLIVFTSNVCDFNGNDAMTLEKNRVLIDVFGEPGKDPGSGWTISGIKNASVDKTVRRNTAIKTGNTDWNAGAQKEWIVISIKDDVTHLGIR